MAPGTMKVIWAQAWAGSAETKVMADLPELPIGIHSIRVTSTDRHGRNFIDHVTIEVMDERPPRYWRHEVWE